MAKVPLVPYSMRFHTIGGARMWAERQFNQLKKFNCNVYIVQESKCYVVARDKCSFDEEPVFLARASDSFGTEYISLNQLSSVCRYATTRSRFVLTNYKIAEVLLQVDSENPIIIKRSLARQ